MALGMCVVSTNAGGIPYLLSDEEDSMLVNTGDSPSMADKVIHLLNNPGKTKLLSFNARKKAEGFDWGTSVKYYWVGLLI